MNNDCFVAQMTDNSGGRECEEEKAGPAVARVSPVTQTTAPATALATSPGGTKLSPPPSYKVNTICLCKGHTV